MATAFSSELQRRSRQRERWRDLSPMRRREAITGLLFISPWIIGVLVFALGPFIASFLLSLTKYNIIQPPEWVGAANYAKILGSDDLFWKSLKNTAVYVGGSVTIRIVLGFLLAMLLNAKVRFLGLWRTLFYVPSVVPIVALSMIWLYVLNGRFGLMNWFLGVFGIARIRWLSDPDFAMLGLLIMSTTWVGVTMIIFLAGLQNIPEEYYEAAKIDGASRMQQMFRITIPLMTPTIYLNVLINIINAFQVFSQVLIMTNGGPRDATRTFVLHIYDNAFSYLPPQMGYASALAWILFMIVFLFTAIIVVTSNRWVFYNN
ncbi:MAG: sugar ABC transporter permease [Anaerolineae bacterium]|nr:sugar ABC transporter permease [Anaerolineae bacterium]